LKKQWLYFLLAFAIPLAVIFWWVGVFASARIETAQVRGPYHYAYLELEGDYSKIPDKQMEALRALEAQKISHGAAVTLMLNDPRTTVRSKLAARVGYLVEPGVVVREPLKLAEVPARPVTLARVRAHPRIAPGKAYAALLEHLESRGRQLRLPTLEIYRNGELTVEMDD
jgi:hypothetical protein